MNTMSDPGSRTRSTFGEQKLSLRAPSPASGHNLATASQDPADQCVVYGELAQQLERIIGVITTDPGEDPACGRIIQAMRGKMQDFLGMPPSARVYSGVKESPVDPDSASASES